jgi:choline dehydrogenase-like flavoprotein
MKMKNKKIIIIGGGTAGLVIAKNLQSHYNIIVIEKSKYRKYPFWYRVPLFIGLLFKSEKTQYISKREHLLLSGRKIPFFDSNLLGGASVMNGCVHMLGSKLQWDSILERFNSNYDDLLVSYKSLYSFNPKDLKKISLLPAFQSDIDAAFIKALKNKGVPLSDTNFSDKEGCGPVLNTIKKYFRTSVLTIIGKREFQQSLDESVEGILFGDNGEVVGVKTSRREIKSDYVILSGGVLGTCDLLLKEQSKSSKASNFFTNLDIGKNIQDHTNLRINILTNKNINSLNEISNSFFKKLSLVFRHFTGVPTLMRGTGATTAAHLDLDKDGLIDTRIQIVQFSETGRAGSDGKLFSSSKPGFSISITPINPESKGVIKLDGNNVNVDPMYLSSEKDVALLKLALVFCLKLLNSDPLSGNILKIEDEDEIINNPEGYIANNVYSGYHLIGGTQNAINSDFSVKNTKGLYVCDASIFDQYAASNIHSSVVLIADIFAKFFINSKS